MRRMQIEVAGGSLAALVAGEGPPALLVHGFPLDAAMWRHQLAADMGRTLVAVHLRGHGDSPWLGDQTHDMDLLATDLAAVIDALGGSADVVGLSMGGYVALALWAGHSEKVRSLTLVDTRAGADSAEARAGRDTTAAGVVENGRPWLARVLLPKLLVPDADLSLHAELLGMIERQPYEGIVADLSGMRDRPDRAALLGTIDVPCLVVVGEHDAITPVADSESMAAGLPSAELVVVDGAGHMSPMEAPTSVNQALAAFWAR